MLNHIPKWYESLSDRHVTLVGTFLGVLAAGLITLIVQYVLTWVKHRFDVGGEKRARITAYHLLRKQHLESLIATLLEYRSIASECREAETEAAERAEALRIKANHQTADPSFAAPEDPGQISRAQIAWTEAKGLSGRCRDLLSRSLVEAEKYGRLPRALCSEAAGRRDLSLFILPIIYWKAVRMMSPSTNERESGDCWLHIAAVIEDLRVLADHEQTLAHHEEPGPIELRYFPKIERIFSEGRIDISTLDFSYVDELDNYRYQPK